MFSKVFGVIQDLEATSSKNSKLEILQANQNLPGLKEFFLAALDPFETYYIKKIPYYESKPNCWEISLLQGISRLKQFTTRSLTGHAAIEELTKILENMHPDDANVIERIIKKDPDCGVQTQVNKVWKNLIREYPVLLCSAYDMKLISKLHWKDGVIVQLKSDGARCNIVISNVGVELFSRAGRPIDVKGRFDYLFEAGLRNVVIDGELLIRGKDGKPMSRKEGNGIVNKCIKGTIPDDMVENIYIMAWDVIPLEDFKYGECIVPYEDRLSVLEEYIDNDGLVLSPTDIAYSFEDAMEICQKYYDAGEEGAILKDKCLPWSSKRAKGAVKLKLELDCDLEVVGYQEGTGKLEGQLGALICQSRDKLLTVSVGGGYSFKQRAQIAANYHGKDVSYTTVKDGIETINVAKPNGEAVLGQILATLYNAKIESDGSWSLFLPRAMTGEFRLDKSVADSFGEIK